MRFLDKVTRERKFGFSDSKLEHRQKCSRNDNIMIVLRIGSVRGVNDAQAAQRQWPIWIKKPLISFHCVTVKV
jgi:hypothetical protein